MSRSTRVRLWIESIMAAFTGVLFVITLVWPDWIERVFEVSPDAGSGSAERMIVLVLAAATIGLALLARFEWRRARAVAGEPSH